MNSTATSQTIKEFDFRAARRVIDDSLAREIDALRDTLSLRPTLSPAAEELSAFLRQPGKRIRPLLFLAGHQLLASRQAPVEAPMEIACALELFHSFILIHDDIVDQSDQRRGRPSLHQCLARIGSPQAGEATALVLGDIVYAWANDLFLRKTVDPDRSLKALRYHLEIARDTGIGELMDIMHACKQPRDVAPDSVLDTYYLKTTRYTFEAPLALAGILSGAHPEWFTTAAEVGRPLGTAFQLENDLHELHKLVAGGTHERDFREASLSLPVVRLAHRLPSAYGFSSDQLQNGNNSGLLRALRESKTLEATRMEVEELFTASDRALERSDLPATIKDGLGKIIAFIKENRNPTAPATVASQQFDRARPA